MRHLLLAIYLLLSLAASTSSKADAERLVIFAASSTKEVMADLADHYPANIDIIFSFGGSAIMAHQISAGAQADIFISANADWVHYMQKKRYLEAAPTVIAHNSLVLAAPREMGHHPLPALTGDSLIQLAKRKPLAIANPATAPAGQYTKRYLKSLGVWSLIEPKAAFSPNVRQTLRLIEYGGLIGFVYASDAKASKKVTVLSPVPSAPDHPIRYLAAPTGSKLKESTVFIDFLTSKDAAPIWEKHGFIAIASN